MQTKFDSSKIKVKKVRKLSKYSRLISVVYYKNGGVSEIARKLKVSRQLVSLWQVKGCIPLKHVLKVAEALGCLPFALNFIGYNEVRVPEDRMEWDKVVQAVKFMPDNITPNFRKKKDVA